MRVWHGGRFSERSGSLLELWCLRYQEQTYNRESIGDIGLYSGIWGSVGIILRTLNGKEMETAIFAVGLLSSFWIECMLTNRGTVLLGLAAQGGKSG